MKHTEDHPEISRHDTLITRYLNGSATSEEVHELETWVSSSEQNQSYFNQIRNIHDFSTAPGIAEDEAWKSVKGRIMKVPFRRRLGKVLSRAAAILVLPLLISTLWLLFKPGHEVSTANVSKFRTVSALFGTTISFTLPDGSLVWLNSGSSLRYPENFDPESRQVYLTGEAFFKVKSDAAHPFLVSTPEFGVKATGTQFNVQAYLNSGYQSVSLAEGKVDVSYDMGANRSHESVRMYPDQHLDIVPGMAGSAVHSDDIYKYYAWKDGKMVFRNDLLKDVSERISLQYNVDIEIADKALKQCRFRATFDNESLNQVLDLLTLSSPIGYRIIQPRVLPDGSFSRKKIIIFSTEPNKP